MMLQNLAPQGKHLYFDVALRRGDRASIHAAVYENPRRTEGVTVLTVHGLSEVGSMFEPLSRAMFADRGLRNSVQRVVALDMVGHGMSGAPTLQHMFGTLTIEDSASSLIQALEQLSRTMRVDVLLGHGVGGLVVQVAQQTLLTSGRSLGDLGVTKAVLLASVPPGGTVWTQLTQPYDSRFVRFDAQLGAILDVPPEYRLGASFCTLRGTMAPGTPQIQAFLANRWSAPEPFATFLQLTDNRSFHGKDDAARTAARCRPFVSPHAFAPHKGTALSVVGFSQDSVALLIDQDDLYEYLTGESCDDEEGLFIPVVAEDAVHASFISNPHAVAEALRRVF